MLASVNIFEPTRTFVFFIVTIFLLYSCEEKVYTPKPRAYPKVEYPTNEGFQLFDKEYCNMKFEYPSYTQIAKDEFFFDDKPRSECWFDMITPSLNSAVHCSFIPISSKDPLDELIKDSYELISKHNIKADYIDEFVVNKKEQKVYGICFEAHGPVASNFQFYLTDSVDNFFRGSLYFNTQTRPDSIAPIADFLKRDIMHLVNTFEWQ